MKLSEMNVKNGQKADGLATDGKSALFFQQF